MTARIDTEIPLPSPTAPPGPVGEADSILTLAGQARPDPYLLEGERVLVRGMERDGPVSVHLDGLRVVEDFRCNSGMAANVVVSPHMVRRECIGAGGTTVVTALALPTLPMAAFQWSRGEGLEVSLDLLAGEDPVRYHGARGTLRAEASQVDSGVGLLIHPDPEEWSVVERAGGGIQVRARISTPDIVTLFVASGSRATIAQTLEAGRHLGAQALRSGVDQDPSNADRLLPVTGVAELDQGVGWATLRMAGALRRGDPVAPADWFWAGVGALASGDARGVLLAADRVRSESFSLVPGGVEAPGGALATLLAARASLLTGAEPGWGEPTSGGADAWERIRAVSDPGAWAWWSLALDALADSLRYAAPESDVQTLREVAGRSAGAVPRTLPMVGAGTVPGSAPWLRALLRGGGLGEEISPVGADDLSPWCSLAAGEVDRGYSAWRASLGRGLTGEPGGPRGGWSPAGRGAGAVAATLAFGILGLEPDAPSGRIRMGPALPAHLAAFRVRGIRVGDARLTFAYARDGRVHRFELDAPEGRTPPMVVLEPSLPSRSLGASRVDGSPADLTHALEGSRTRVRVQIPVDGPRIVEIEEA